MSIKNGLQRDRSSESIVEKLAIKGVIAVVVVMLVIAFAMAVNGMHQSDSVAAQITPTVQPSNGAAYFPDGYVNQATTIEPQPPTF